MIVGENKLNRRINEKKKKGERDLIAKSTPP